MSNPYINIISQSLRDIISFEMFEDYLDEEITIHIISIVESALKIIQNDWVDARDYSNFNMLLDLHKEGNPTLEKMLRRIRCYHKDSLQECEREGWEKLDNFHVENENKEPEYRSFDSLSDEEKANSKWDFPKRFVASLKKPTTEY